jgi:hypothetical protein
VSREIEALRRAIQRCHGVASSHLRSVLVHETFEGESVWDGVVEVFRLKNHPKARLGYAWSYETDEGGRGASSAARGKGVFSVAYQA